MKFSLVCSIISLRSAICKDKVQRCTASKLGQQLHAACSDLAFHPSVPQLNVERVCTSCNAHPCVFALLWRWSGIAPRVPSGYMFSKMYVIHYSPRTWRRKRMIDRAAAIGLPVAAEAGVVSFVDDFDADSLSDKELQCLRNGNRRRLSMHFNATKRLLMPGRSSSQHRPAAQKAAPTLTPNQISVNAKHYAAMLDMLRHGIQYALIVEDDATFESGSKRLEDKSTGKVTKAQFDVTKLYPGSHSFNETMTKFVVPHLPNWLNKPANFGGVVGSSGPPLSDGDFVFDHLSLGACDMYWKHVYGFGSSNGLVASNAGKLHRNVHVFNGHISVSSWSCSRCLIAYISSLSGATRLLSKQGLPWVASIDIHITWASGRRVSEGRHMDCLWVEPPIAWEVNELQATQFSNNLHLSQDPGEEGDGLEDASRLVIRKKVKRSEVQKDAMERANESIWDETNDATTVFPNVSADEPIASCFSAPSFYTAEDFETATPMNTKCVAPSRGVSKKEACPRTQWLSNSVYSFLGAAIGSTAVMTCRKRIYLDLGANAFQSSILWAITKYPVPFDEIHAWEMVPNLFPHIPNQATHAKRYPERPLPSLIMTYNAAADSRNEGCEDSRAPNKKLALGSHCAGLKTCARLRELIARWGSCSRVNISQYMRYVAREADFVVVKMDVEGFEYKILDELVDSGSWRLVDEVMVEFHFQTKAPGISGWGRPGGPAWRSYPARAMTFEDARNYVQTWREQRTPAFHVYIAASDTVLLSRIIIVFAPSSHRFGHEVARCGKHHTRYSRALPLTLPDPHA